MKHRITLFIVLLALVSTACQSKVKTTLSQHSDLLQLFSEWRVFERPPQLDGAPDYTAETFAKRQRDYQQLRQRRNANTNRSDRITIQRQHLSFYPPLHNRQLAG